MRPTSFVNTVIRVFGFLSAEGFRITEENPGGVRYETSRAFVAVFLEPGSYAIDVRMGLGRSDGFLLGEVVSALAPGERRPTTFQASTEGALDYCMREIAALIADHCLAYLRCDARAIETVERVAAAARQERSRKATLLATFGAVLVRADAAWQHRQLDEAQSLYTEAEPALDDTRRRRLRYLRSRATPHPGHESED